MPTFPVSPLTVLQNPQLSLTARLHALEALRHELPSEELLPLLLRLLRAHDEPIGLRVEAAFALAYIEDPEAAEGLEALLNDPDPQLRTQAIQNIHTMQDQERLFPKLLAALEDPHPWVRDAAGDAVGFLLQVDSQKEGGQLEDRGQALALLLRCLNDEDVGVRQSAAYALGYLGDERAREVLSKKLQEEDDYARARVIFALAQLQDRRALAAAIALINGSEHAMARETAVEALGLLGLREARLVLEQLLQRGKLRVVAAEALGELGDPKAIPPLKRAHKSKKRRLREAASKALTQLKSREKRGK